MWFSGEVSHTGAELSHLISSSLLENTACSAEDRRRLSEIAKYRFKIMEMQKMGKIFMNTVGCLHSWKNWVQLCPTAEPSFPNSALPFSVLLAFPQLSCASCNTYCCSQNLTYVDLGELKITWLFKYVFSSHVLVPSEQNTQKTPHPRKNMKEDGSKGSETIR